MKLDEVVAWYQKKIGTYDKQQWEKTVEQRILSGFTNVPLKNTKLRTEFIDVDLVRGSTFPKAKPKQSLLTVLRLAFIRFVFLPVYAKWWVAQTSPKVFAFFLTLYSLQMFNWAVYSYNIHKINDGNDKQTATCSQQCEENESQEHFVSLTELLVPLALSLALSLIHSQIVATASSNALSSSKQRKYSGDVLQAGGRKRRERRKRKKHLRIRSVLNGAATEQPSATISQKSCLAGSSRRVVGVSLCTDNSFTSNAIDSTPSPKGNKKMVKIHSDCEIMEQPIEVSPQLRKRNVYWDSPIKSQVNISAKIENDSNEDSENAQPPTENERATDQTAGDDDGFESLNGKSSSGEEMTAGVLEMEIINDDLLDSATKHLITAGGTGDCDPEAINGNVKYCDAGRARNIPNFRQTLPITAKFNSKMDSSETDEEGDDADSQPSSTLTPPFPEIAASTTEWIGITTNSEECSYSSCENNSESQLEYSENGGGEFDNFTPTVILNSSCGLSDRISCTIWDGRETKKAEMSVLDISSAIIERVEAIPETCDYIYIGLAFSIVLSLVPAFCRLCEALINSSESTELNFFDMPALLMEKTPFSCERIFRLSFGKSGWQKTVLFIDFVLRLCLTFLFFFLLAVAERTFKQRFLYAKLFSHLTSSRRARKSELPHFRLNKVRNIKTWLSVRSYLKRRGPQRSVDVIVSAAFILTLLLLAFLSVEWLKDSVQLQSQHNLEALIWSCALGCFILRFMTLGTKINRKYRSISVLITEQINLYLQIEQKPHNKDELMVSNSVLKLAADLLKELESPFKISGLSANPYLYTTVKVVILSALSGVLSEMLGFKLKLHKIKIK